MASLDSKAWKVVDVCLHTFFQVLSIYMSLFLNIHLLLYAYIYNYIYIYIW